MRTEIDVHYPLPYVPSEFSQDNFHIYRCESFDLKINKMSFFWLLKRNDFLRVHMLAFLGGREYQRSPGAQNISGISPMDWSTMSPISQSHAPAAALCFVLLLPKWSF